MKGKLAFGYQTGKVGSLVGFKGAGGEQVWREYVQKPANPKTEAQALQRYRWAALCAAWSSLRKIPVLAFDDKPGNQSTFNQFITANHGMNITVPDSVSKAASEGTKGWLAPYLITRGTLGTLCNVSAHSDLGENIITQGGEEIATVNAVNADAVSISLFERLNTTTFSFQDLYVATVSGILMATVGALKGDMVTFVAMYNGVLSYFQFLVDNSSEVALSSVTDKLGNAKLTDMFDFENTDGATAGTSNARISLKNLSSTYPISPNYPTCGTIILSRATSGSSFEVSTERLSMIFDSVSSFVGEDAAKANYADYIKTSQAILDPSTATE